MTAMEHKTPSPLVERLAADKDVLKDLMREALQAVPEGEMAGFLGARRASARHCAMSCCLTRVVTGRVAIEHP